LSEKARSPPPMRIMKRTRKTASRVFSRGFMV
jgi:hypothetical protein